MFKSKGESGSELLARLRQNPSQALTLLEPELFPSGIEPRTVIELYGEEGSGKTQYLIQLIANAILPPSLKGSAIGGLGVSVILIDNDYSFNLLRLISILELRISSDSVSPAKHSASCEENLICSIPGVACAVDENAASVHVPKKPRTSENAESLVSPILSESVASPLKHTTEQCETSQTHCRESIDKMDLESLERCVKECLKRLYVVHCNSSAQLFITLHALETVLANRSEMRLLAIDGISSFYWLDKFNGTENNLNLVADILQKLVETYGLVVFATKSSALCQRPHRKDTTEHASRRDEHKEYLCKAWQKLVSSRIVFSKDLSGEIDLGSSQVFCASVGGRECKRFTLDDSGVKFLMQNVHSL